MENFNFTEDDIAQIQKHGLTISQIKEQLNTFKKGMPFINLVAPATSGNGIIKLNDSQLQRFIKKYDATSTRTVKFTPASGAATRMFKTLHQFLKEYNPQKETLKTFLERTDNKTLNKFLNQLEKLPFYDTVKAQMHAKFTSQRDTSSDQAKVNFIKFLLEDLNYANSPKGLIPFHHYSDRTLTPFEEHLKEAATYLKPAQSLKLHFTVSPHHLDSFKAAFINAEKNLGQKVSKYEFSYSFQSHSTDTIAAGLDNQPFRDKENKLFFRPGGHGALIENLNAIDTDLIFIKNIDNVVLDKDLPIVTAYKKALAGLLLTIQGHVFKLLEEVDNNEFSSSIKETAEDLALEYFHRQKEFESSDEIMDFFDRPIRVCGMVKNQGEPGGGPFWIRLDNNKFSLQIVESSQINMNDKKQAAILQKSTHFNPVDLVCGVKNYKGEKFDLQEFVAPNQGFISKKYKDGKPLKALELPGLWNGSMAYWNSIFVEVPLETFNPVKTVVDLLRPSHQA